MRKVYFINGIVMLPKMLGASGVDSDLPLLTIRPSRNATFAVSFCCATRSSGVWEKSLHVSL